MLVALWGQRVIAIWVKLLKVQLRFMLFLLLFFIAEGRAIVSFILNESFQDITLHKALSFKKSLCKHLKLIPAEFTFVTTVKIPRKHLVFQLPSEVLPFLRHCTGWRKEWLFSLNVNGVQVSGEDEISVHELKISQLRLQEDPGMTGIWNLSILNVKNGKWIVEV